MEQTIRRSFQQGCHMYELLMGEEDFKTIWADAEEALEDHLLPLTMEGRIITAWHAYGLNRFFSGPRFQACSKLAPARVRQAIGGRLQSHAALIADMRPRGA